MNDVLYQAAALMLNKSKTQLSNLEPGSVCYVTSELTKLEAKLMQAYHQHDEQRLHELSKDILDLGQSLDSLQLIAVP